MERSFGDKVQIRIQKCGRLNKVDATRTFNYPMR